MDLIDELMTNVIVPDDYAPFVEEPSDLKDTCLLNFLCPTIGAGTKVHCTSSNHNYYLLPPFFDDKSSVTGNHDFLEDSSLLQGTERELASILQSVMDIVDDN
jgi:hypothetical protein